MGTLRAFLRKHFRLAMLLGAMALVMKVAVPAGYMLGTQDKVLTVLVCADASGGHLVKEIVIPGSGTTEGQSKANAACPYGLLSLSSLQPVDLQFIALALAFILLLGFAPVRIPRLAGRTGVWPPLRGPPALI